MYVHTVECDDCERNPCVCADADGLQCNNCDAVHSVAEAYIPGTPYLFCWNCVRTKKALEARR